jgi:molybdopterin synthase catalytic subunit
MADPVPAAHTVERFAPVHASVRVQEADFDIGAELGALQSTRTDMGALASFTGCVRGAAPGEPVTSLTLEHYPGMTERAIAAMVDEAARRFPIQGVRVVHRVGRLAPGERIVLVAVAAKHRHEAFRACEFLMDYLKTNAPFWKKEATPQGGHWVDARVEDDEALARWGIASVNAATGEAGDNERRAEPASTDIADDASLATHSRATP